MTKAVLPDMYVLDALASDLESLDDIIRMLNSESDLGWRREWGADFRRPEIVQALVRLLRSGLVRCYLWDETVRGLVQCSPRALPPGDFDAAWYGITDQGRLVHGNWAPHEDGSGS